MRKIIFLGMIVLVRSGAISQNTSALRPSGMVEVSSRADCRANNENVYTSGELLLAKKNDLKKTDGKKVISGSWQKFTSSMNIHGVTLSYCKPLQWNDELNVTSFVHRKSFTYNITPTPSSLSETGAMVVMISPDCGEHWDSTAIYSNDNFWGRYPSGAIYNPENNTDINNSYFVGAGPATGSSTGWTGNWYASKNLNPINYNGAPSMIPNAQQIMTPAGPFMPGLTSRHDFAAYGFTATDDGKMRILAGIRNDVSASDTAIMLMTGTFTNGVFSWEGTIFDPPTTSSSDGTENWVSTPMMAWNEQGTVGYVVVMGARLNATQSNAGHQPIVYKTINSGATWSLEDHIDFNHTGYEVLKKMFWPVRADSTLTVLNFYWGEGMDVAVDGNNQLHIFTTLLGHSSAHPDSLNYVNQFTTDRYLWPHFPGKRPYLFDFKYSGASTNPEWSYLLIDSMSSEGIGSAPTHAGYQDNIWDANANNGNTKVRMDARLQMSRTPDGNYLVYSWAESDTAFTYFQRKWNNLPTVKVRLLDIQNSELYAEADITANADGDIAYRATCHFIAPKFKFVSHNSFNNTTRIRLPATVSNSNPFSQLTSNNHWFSCNEVDFSGPFNCIFFNPSKDVGLFDQRIEQIDTRVYPNPAAGKVYLTIQLKKSVKVEVKVVNLLGQVLLEKNLNALAGANSFQLDLENLEAGIYFVNVNAHQASASKKLIIE